MLAKEQKGQTSVSLIILTILWIYFGYGWTFFALGDPIFLRNHPYPAYCSFENFSRPTVLDTYTITLMILAPIAAVMPFLLKKIFIDPSQIQE